MRGFSETEASITNELGRKPVCGRPLWSAIADSSQTLRLSEKCPRTRLMRRSIA